MDIGAKIKRLRLTNGLTLEELANRSELTKGFLSQLERDLTSPSVATLEDILEALGTTKLNLLCNVGFNQEVGLDSCIYWGKEDNNLQHVIEHVETFEQHYIDALGENAKQRVKEAYNWEKIIKEYEDLLTK